MTLPNIVVNPSDLAGALANSQVNETSEGGKTYLRFDAKNGQFNLGMENEDVTGEEIVVNTGTIGHGWITWVGKKPTKTQVSFTQPLPAQPAPIEGNIASESRVFDARFEDDDDTIIEFSTNSLGGRRGVDKLLGAIRARATEGETEFLYPVVKLNASSYTSKHGNVIWNPNFDIVGWVNQAGADQPKAIESTPPEPEVEPEPEPAPAPSRRRRRAS